MAKYNGHKNWNHWNVSLWINNEEWMYRLALNYIDADGSKDAAARHLLETLPEKTPDGAPYSYSSVRAALVGM
jgi:ABC-type glycerol-3-phosphate transport system substrate-binding protein